ncbi:Sortase family enzyme [Corynebacterium camporealensis]|uniref:Sortase family enzyme n=1 Tax=Corynebacterium camporealensis TaxID=161896 RepID=A0A0F6QX57_9CORY|nr:class F sortase [Corynebacterium camporealensis]AKE39812.1 sortase family enzyme [Corynebacterium camporealensis]AVH88932.1 Sortase family enzyme [Corynebacterium camporealensis]
MSDQKSPSNKTALEAKESSIDEHSHKAGASRWILLLLTVVLIALLAGVALYAGLRSSETSDSGAGEQLPVAQTDLPEPAPGIRDGVNEMQLKIGGESAKVEFVQLTDQGALIPPEDVSKVGWYSASAVPGQEGPTVGTSVITGHVNEIDQGDGFAAKFPELRPGDVVSVIVDGEERQFTVSKDPIRVVKGAELPESVNRSTGENELVLITCGGEFVGGTLGYADNIVVEATPL